MQVPDVDSQTFGGEAYGAIPPSVSMTEDERGRRDIRDVGFEAFI